MAKVKALKLYIAIGVLLLVFIPPFAKFQELCYKRRKLEDRLISLRSENKKLANEKRRLETDIAYIEKKVRDRIGVVRKGEIVLKEEAPKRR
ncbi:MAG: septum formation initiator family protein [Candidatus Omnitrophota bacterium]|nr:septum formation initiator family protein [Candidatus Omnitrophota bacterium]